MSKPKKSQSKKRTSLAEVAEGLDLSTPQSTFVVSAAVPSPDAANILQLVAAELVNVAAKHPLYNSAHEGFGVLAEEVDELWDEVRKKRDNRSVDNMTKECVQIASCAIRFALSMKRQKEVDRAMKRHSRVIDKKLREIDKAKKSAKRAKTRSEF